MEDCKNLSKDVIEHAANVIDALAKLEPNDNLTHIVLTLIVCLTVIGLIYLMLNHRKQSLTEKAVDDCRTFFATCSAALTGIDTKINGIVQRLP